MKMPLSAAFLALMLAPAATAGAGVGSAADPGDRRGDQAMAFEGRKAGKLLPLDQLIKRVSAQLPGWDYTGFDFDADSSGKAVYKLVFVRDGNVTWIYVDGRTGETIGRR